MFALASWSSRRPHRESVLGAVTRSTSAAADVLAAARTRWCKAPCLRRLRAGARTVTREADRAARTSRSMRCRSAANATGASVVCRFEVNTMQFQRNGSTMSSKCTAKKVDAGAEVDAGDTDLSGAEKRRRLLRRLWFEAIERLGSDCGMPSQRLENRARRWAAAIRLLEERAAHEAAWRRRIPRPVDRSEPTVDEDRAIEHGRLSTAGVEHGEHVRHRWGRRRAP